jgi:hypothetical protein
VEELHSASGTARDIDAAAAEQLVDEGDSDDAEWEDDPDTLDLGLGTTKQGTSCQPPSFWSTNHFPVYRIDGLCRGLSLCHSSTR